jgi:hypothetical protein
MGEIQDPDEIEGFNEYNPDICYSRNIGAATSFIEWVTLHRNAYTIKKAHILMTGDLIAGDIHDELRVTNAFPVPEQVYQAACVHATQIGLIAAHFDHVTVEFLTEDNHARLTKKPQAKEAGLNSHNYSVGRLLQAMLEKHTNVTFNLIAMHEKVVHVANRNYLITHGHGIKAWMGIPWYGIERRAGRESTSRLQLIMEEYDRAKTIGYHKIVHGHFHTPFDANMYSCGGSVSGTSAYDHQAGRYAPPSQPAWLVHPKWGEFNRINFQLKFF